MTPILATDDDHRVLAESAEDIDRLNARFYGRFPYPWQPVKFDAVEDDELETVMLNQDVGDFTHRRIPIDARVWIAGCGTNQAVQAALRFPNARVLGTDISPASLELCASAARS